ncbi:MAG: hypothetical protein M3R04_01015, partial [bacterium]|nr:hypothetical protein [bacterium]
MKTELRIFPPSSTDYWLVAPLALELDQAASYPAQLTAVITSNWQLGQQEDNASNPLRRGAYIEYWEGSTCLFRGKVKRVARTVANGKPAITIVALDKLQVLNETFALHGGDFV